MGHIGDILKKKGADVWSISPDATVFEALQLMADKEIGAVVVIEGGRPIGIMSERDYARKVILRDRASHSTPVREIMSPRPVCIRPGQSCEEAMALMSARRIRHLPVIEDGALVGIISIGDLVQAKIADQKFMIQQLESYITG
ncbi:MAG: CBS domain-containing protein [Acidobacteriota bacterium]